jgi:hypothetical protein
MKTERKYVELDLASIVSAGENLRDTAPRLSQKGFAVFEDTEQLPSLKSLALSTDATEQALYVTLDRGGRAGHQGVGRQHGHDRPA